MSEVEGSKVMYIILNIAFYSLDAINYIDLINMST